MDSHVGTGAPRLLILVSPLCRYLSAPLLAAGLLPSSSTCATSSGGVQVWMLYKIQFPGQFLVFQVGKQKNATVSPMTERC